MYATPPGHFFQKLTLQTLPFNFIKLSIDVNKAKMKVFSCIHVTSVFLLFFDAILPQINHFIERWRFGQMWLFVSCQEQSTDSKYALAPH
jgi:hypothetical protein